MLFERNYGYIGDLGAGKSTFSRGLIREAFGDPSMLVTSPSYLIDNKYDLPDGHIIHHIDLYRLPPKKDFGFLNIPEIYSSSVCLIEWPERLKNEDYPKEYLTITLTINEDETRLAEIECVGLRWTTRFKIIEEVIGSIQ